METPSRRTVESLAGVVYETKPNVSNLMAGAVIAMLLIGGGLFLSGYMVRQMFFESGNRPQTPPDWLGAVLLALIGIALTVGGVLLLRWVRSLFGFRLRVLRRRVLLHPRRRMGLCVGRDCTRPGNGAARKTAVGQGRSTPADVCENQPHLYGRPMRWQRILLRPDVIPRTSLRVGPLSSAVKQHGFAWETTEEEA